MTLVPSVIMATILIIGSPGNQRDWVGLFQEGAPNNQFITWVYVACGNQSCSGAKATEGTVTFKIPFDKCGPCEVRLMSAVDVNSYKVIETISLDLHGFSEPFP